MKLGDVITLQRGHDLPRKKRRSGPYPIVSSSGITGYHDEFKAEGPGVVTGRYGTLGEFFYISGRYWPLNTALWVRDFKSNDPRFIFYFLQTLDFARSNVAGAVPGVNRNVLHAKEVRLPPLPTQRRIAGILSAYDDLIENNTKRIKILEEMARALYREWFVYFRFPGHEKVKLVDSPLGQIPEGWKVTSLEDACQCIVDTEHKTAPTQTTGYPSIRTPNVGRGRLLLDGVRRVSDTTYREWTRRETPRPGDLILAREAPVGNVAIIPKGQQVCLGQRTVLLRPSPDVIGPHSLVRILLGDQVQHTITGIASGATVAHLNMRDIRALRVPIPEQTVLDLAEPRLESIDHLIGVLMAMSSNLRETRDLLLPRLISGEIDVTSLDLPEVA